MLASSTLQLLQSGKATRLFETRLLESKDCPDSNCHSDASSSEIGRPVRTLLQILPPGFDFFPRRIQPKHWPDMRQQQPCMKSEITCGKTWVQPSVPSSSSPINVVKTDKTIQQSYARALVSLLFRPDFWRKEKTLY